MIFRASTPQRAERTPVRRNSVMLLGWTHFWLLGGTLAGILGLIWMVFLIHLSTL